MTPVVSKQVLQEETQQYAETKKNLRKNIKVLRDTVRERIFHSLILLFPYIHTFEVKRLLLIVSGSFQIKAMIQENESLPDMEKLGHQEFNLDVEEQQRMQLEGKQEVNRVNMVIYR